MRAQAAATLNELFVREPTLAVVLSDISVDLFAPSLRHDPRRAVNVGIMEQTAVGLAAGFALEGFHPVFHTIAPFLAERALEQIKLDFGYQGLGGLFVSVGASYDYVESGGTHHSPGDVAAFGSVPSATVLVPGAPEETGVLVRRFWNTPTPTYLRTSVGVNATARELAAGGLTVVRRGAGFTVVAVGPYLDRTLVAVEGLDATLLYATTIVPLDGETLAAEAAASDVVIVVEPFFAGTLAPQVVAALDRPVRVVSIGVPRVFLSRYGSIEQHDHAFGLDASGIRAQIHAALRAGRRGAALLAT